MHSPTESYGPCAKCGFSGGPHNCEREIERREENLKAFIEYGQNIWHEYLEKNEGA